MKFELSKIAKAKMKAVLCNCWGWLRAVGPPTLAWIMTHKAIVVIILLVIYILFIPKGASSIKAPKATHTSEATTPINVSPPTTQATAVPATANGVVLYDATQGGADPKWALPAQLGTAENLKLAASLKKLRSDDDLYSEREQSLTEEYEALGDGKIRQLLFDRIASTGFKDAELPIIWRRISKYSGLNGVAEQMTDAMAQVAAETTLSLRLLTAEDDVIAGTPTVGDTLFVAAFQKHLNDGNRQLDDEMPVVADFCKRIVVEFPQLELTYYDRDGTKHFHAAKVLTKTPVTPEELAAMQKLYAECNAGLKPYNDLVSADAIRKEVVEDQREFIMKVGDAGLKTAWTSVTQARKLDYYSMWEEQFFFQALPDRLISAQASEDDKLKLESFAEKLKTETADAKQQKDLQFKFKKMAAAYPDLNSALFEYKAGDQPPDWETGN